MNSWCATLQLLYKLGFLQEDKSEVYFGGCGFHCHLPWEATSEKGSIWGKFKRMGRNYPLTSTPADISHTGCQCYSISQALYLKSMGHCLFFIWGTCYTNAYSLFMQLVILVYALKWTWSEIFHGFQNCIQDRSGVYCLKPKWIYASYIGMQQGCKQSGSSCSPL